MTKLKSNILHCAPVGTNNNDCKKVINNPYAKTNAHQKQPPSKLSLSVQRGTSNKDILGQALDTSTSSARGSSKSPIPKLLSEDPPKKGDIFNLIWMVLMAKFLYLNQIHYSIQGDQQM